MSRTIKELEKCFEVAKQTGKKYVGVAVTVPRCTGYEVIINPEENFDVKLRYYKNAYTEDLKLSTFNIIRIVAFASGMNYSEIEQNLYIQIMRNKVEANYVKDAETR